MANTRHAYNRFIIALPFHLYGGQPMSRAQKPQNNIAVVMSASLAVSHMGSRSIMRNNAYFCLFHKPGNTIAGLYGSSVFTAFSNDRTGFQQLHNRAKLLQVACLSQSFFTMQPDLFWTLICPWKSLAIILSFFKQHTYPTPSNKKADAGESITMAETRSLGFIVTVFWPVINFRGYCCNRSCKLYSCNVCKDKCIWKKFLFPFLICWSLKILVHTLFFVQLPLRRTLVHW